jgi:membrane-associated protein
METWEFLKDLTNPESIIRVGGVALLLVVVFAETGLLIGFFLPGDSLMFIAGLLCRTRPDLIGVNIFVLILLLVAAATLGNMTGYWFGKRVGPALFKRDDSWIFKKKYIEVTRSFYERHGGKALVMGRFLPIIRTFAPILAGVIAIDFKKFMVYNVVGAVLWIGTLATLGYFLGEVDWVNENLEKIVIGLIIITLIPVITTWRKERKLQKQDKTDV